MGWYVNVIAVDPRDPERVWAGGVDWFRSDDGGRNWGLVSSMATTAPPGQAVVHVDQHGIAFHPALRRRQAIRPSSSRTTAVSSARQTPARRRPRVRVPPCSPVALQLRWETLNRGYGVTQFYHGLPFPDGQRYLGGTQDNGTILGADDAGSDGWRGIFGGDGGYVAVDPGNTQTLYVESQWSQHPQVDEWRRPVRAGCARVSIRFGLTSSARTPIICSSRRSSWIRRTRSGCGWAASICIAR